MYEVYLPFSMQQRPGNGACLYLQDDVGCYFHDEQESWPKRSFHV